MRRFFFIILTLIFIGLSTVTFAIDAMELVPADKIPSGAGELIGIDTVGVKANYYICYTFKDPYGKIVTYVYQVGGDRIKSAGDLSIFLSHIIRPMD